MTRPTPPPADDGWNDLDADWGDWTDDYAAPVVDSDAAARRREAARSAAEDDDPEFDERFDRAMGTDAENGPGSKRRSGYQAGSQGGSQAGSDEYLAPPVRRGRGCLTSLIVLAMLAGLVAFGLRWARQQVDPSGPAGITIEVGVPSGTSGSGLGKILAAEGVISNPTAWRIWSQINTVGKFQAGRYEFQKSSSFDEVVAVLAKEPLVAQEQKITIPPGFRITQIAERVGALPGRNAQRFLEVARSRTVKSALLPVESANNLEGFIVAETLNFDLDDDETDVLVKLVDEFDRTARKTNLMNAKDLIGYTPYEALIVASLIEREAKFADERGKVARVIYNRLKGETRLQLDATTVYDLGGGVPTAADLKKDAPYNTYTRKGLPPTPICTPSIESIEAALNPTVGDWRYYVVTETDGRSSFANTFEEHKQNIRLGKKNGVLNG
jgi:UPF0755 protein